jgi:hypothetical protein
VRGPEGIHVECYEGGREGLFRWFLSVLKKGATERRKQLASEILNNFETEAATGCFFSRDRGRINNKFRSTCRTGVGGFYNTREKKNVFNIIFALCNS